MDWFSTFVPHLLATGAIIAAIAAFVLTVTRIRHMLEVLSKMRLDADKRALETEKLNLEIAKLREQLHETQSQIKLPSLKEIERYGMQAQAILDKARYIQADAEEELQHIKKQAYRSEEKLYESMKAIEEMQNTAQHLSSIVERELKERGSFFERELQDQSSYFKDTLDKQQTIFEEHTKELSEAAKKLRELA